MTETPVPLDVPPHERDRWLRSLEPQPYEFDLWQRPAPRRSGWRAWGLNLVFFVLTIGSMHQVGGWRLVFGLMPILISHEMGHYIACRLYRVDATLPYFIPVPILSIVGTLGAFIRIRGPIPHRKALFDIGIAGPLAGFVVCLPIVVLGALEATTVSATSINSPAFGVPPLFGWVFDWLRGDPPDGQMFMMGPLGLAAWFGLFVTALNLIPVGQLDGGHVVYALLGKRALLVSRLAFVGCLGLLYLRPTWLLWCVLLLLFGRRHPPTLDDYSPAGWARIVVGVIGLLVFALSFTPSPFIISWSDFRDILVSLFTSG